MNEKETAVMPDDFSRTCTCGADLTKDTVEVLQPKTDIGVFYNCESCGTTLIIPSKEENHE